MSWHSSEQISATDSDASKSPSTRTYATDMRAFFLSQNEIETVTMRQVLAHLSSTHGNQTVHKNKQKLKKLARHILKDLAISSPEPLQSHSRDQNLEQRKQLRLQDTMARHNTDDAIFEFPRQHGPPRKKSKRDENDDDDGGDNDAAEEEEKEQEEEDEEPEEEAEEEENIHDDDDDDENDEDPDDDDNNDDNDDINNSHPNPETSAEGNASHSRHKPKKEKRKRKLKRNRKSMPRLPKTLSNFSKPVVLENSLANLLGVSILPRFQVAQRVMLYAKENGLQSNHDKRNFSCNDRLKAVLGVENFTQFSIQKLLAPMIKKTDDWTEDEKSKIRSLEVKLLAEKKEQVEAKREKIAKELGSIVLEQENSPRRSHGENQNTQSKHTLQKPTKVSLDSRNSLLGKNKADLNQLMLVSEQLKHLTGKDLMPRTDVVRVIWDYIKKNDLYVENNKLKIRCDDVLRTICNGEDEVHMFTINKHIGAHLTPQNENS